jgi:hypothetical protein
LVLDDLHDLLQHYEECHVKFEDDSSLSNPVDPKFYNNSWSKMSSEYNLGVDVPASFAYSFNPEIFGMDNNMISESSSPDASLNQSSRQGLELIIPEMSNIASGVPEGLEVNRSNSNVNINDLNQLYQNLGAGLPNGQSNLVNSNKRVRPGIDTPPLTCSQSSTSNSAENTPPLSPSVCSSLNLTPEDGSFDFSFLMQANPIFQYIESDSHINKKLKSADINSNDIQSNKFSSSNLGLTFGSSALSLYDDDIISALASSTDPLFLVKDAKPAQVKNKQRKNLVDVDKPQSSNLLRPQGSGKPSNQRPKKTPSSYNLPASLSAAMADAVSNEAARLSFNRQKREDKPHKCTVPGCDKAYKNPNGLKYHILHGHCNVDVPSSMKPYKCLVPNCFRAYKNLNGLKYHILHTHSLTEDESLFNMGSASSVKVSEE